mmetsp:Transcript_29999/g.95793  ORF Transcript_29999/g.95793 Transcript_29999/m.95793 type:complete len:355 (+) Transcript_29999:636-1700(+)
MDGEVCDLARVLPDDVRAVVRRFPVPGVAAGPHACRSVLRGGQHHVLGRVEGHGHHLLRVALQLLRRLLLLPVEDHDLTVHAARDDAAVVGLVDVEAEHARGRGLVGGVGARAREPLDVVPRRQVGEVPLLPRPRQALRDVGHPLDDLRRQARLRLVALHGGSGGFGGLHVLKLVAELRHLSTRGVPLLQQARDDAAGGVVLVQGVRELLAGGVEVRLELVGLRHQRVPLALQQRQHARDGGRGGRARPHGLVRLDLHEVVLGELLLGHRALAGTLHVLHDDPLLVDMPRLGREDRLLRGVACDGAHDGRHWRSRPLLPPPPLPCVPCQAPAAVGRGARPRGGTVAKTGPGGRA